MSSELIAEAVRQDRNTRAWSGAAVAASSGDNDAMMLTGDMKRVVLEQRLGFVATVCPDGTPNLSPKGTTTIFDDEHLLFADIRSPHTIRNLQTNPGIEVNVVDPIIRKGYRFKGTASVHSQDDIYHRGLRLLADLGYEATPRRIRTVALVKVERAEALTSPAYDSGASEEEVSRTWIERLSTRSVRSPVDRHARRTGPT
jgi:uncharacterized protein